MRRAIHSLGPLYRLRGYLSRSGGNPLVAPASRHGLVACRRAATAVEFAIASVPLLVLTFGFTATCAVFVSWSSMQSNAQYAARMLSTGQITQNSNGTISASNLTATVTCGASMSTSRIEYYACNGLPSWASFTVTSAEDCSVPSVTVSLSANAATAAIADVVAIFSGKTIRTQAVLMKEGTCP
jgi:Flp pilus assembly protein TadG